MFNKMQSALVTGFVLPVPTSISRSDKSATDAGVTATRRPLWSSKIRVNSKSSRMLAAPPSISNWASAQMSARLASKLRQSVGLRLRFLARWTAMQLVSSPQPSYTPKRLPPRRPSPMMRSEWAVCRSTVVRWKQCLYKMLGAREALSDRASPRCVRERWPHNWW